MEGKEMKNHKFIPERGNRGEYRRENSRSNGNGRAKSEGTMNTMDKAVMIMMNRTYINKTQEYEEETVKYADTKAWFGY